MKKLASGRNIVLLIVYLLICLIAATFTLIANIPLVEGPPLQTTRFQLIESGFHLVRFDLPKHQALALLAFLAGMIGSFIHAAQSLGTYVGNRNFFSSWVAWYFLRPWIGGVLGFTLYFVLAGGLIAGIESSKPLSIMGVALLGGWFSKPASDKLQVVFETFFNTDEDAKRKDGPREDLELLVSRVTPQPIQPNDIQFTIHGQGFLDGLVLIAEGEAYAVRWMSEHQVVVDLSVMTVRPKGQTLMAKLRNPGDQGKTTQPFPLEFEGVPDPQKPLDPTGENT